jgi:uncharacterized protein (DUF2141 family)
MKRFTGCFIFFLFSIVGFSQSKIVADISNVKNDNGVCRACIFNNAEAFKGETGRPYECVVARVKNAGAQAIFNNVPAGIYAIFVFHDANSNSKIDKNFIGIPKEGYGASKNKLPFAGAPTYNENKFAVDGKTTLRLPIKLRNL